MRALALSVVALSLVVTAPSPARSSQSPGELYRKASPSIVVIRAKGREVSTSGVVRFGEIGSGVLVTPDGKVFDGQMVSGPVAKLLNVPQDGGYLVKTVVKDSLAERLGLLGGDIILTAQGIELGSLDDLIQAAKVIRDQPPGREVRMRVLRAGKVLELTATWSGGPEAGAAPR